MQATVRISWIYLCHMRQVHQVIQVPKLSGNLVTFHRVGSSVTQCSLSLATFRMLKAGTPVKTLNTYAAKILIATASVILMYSPGLRGLCLSCFSPQKCLSWKLNSLSTSHERKTLSVPLSQPFPHSCCFRLPDFSGPSGLLLGPTCWE